MKAAVKIEAKPTTNGTNAKPIPKPVQEYQVVVPPVNDKQRYSILQFNGPLNIDPAKWPTCEIKMAREDNRAHAVGPSAIVQDYGEGSEYGRAAREEARRKRYGRQTRKYFHDRQPWQLTIKDPSKDPPERNYRSVCEGGAGEHSDYWIFSKTQAGFHAHKIDDWYRFMPQSRHRTLDIDQAEEQFQHRNKVLNQFALKAKIQQTLKEQDEEGDKVAKVSNLRIKDEASDSDEEGGEKDESKGILDADAVVPKGGKPKKGKKAQKDKRQRVENADDVVKYESEDGEDEGREYDYMSDSGSDTSREEVDVDDKMAKEMVAVGDETGMKDSSDEEEDEEKEDEEKNETKKQLMKKLREQNQPKEEEDQEMRVVDQVDERDSSGSDTDDPDSPKSKTSVLFMQRKERKRAAEDNAGPSDSKKAKTASREPTPSVVKEASAVPAPAPVAPQPTIDRLDEETVRRLLLKKPHTTKELLNKIRPHCGDMNKTDIVARLAGILRNIEPHQFRQTVNKKDVLFFSLKPP